MEKVDVILKIVFIAIGIPLLFIETESAKTELIFCIGTIKIGILFLMIWSIIKIYRHYK